MAKKGDKSIIGIILCIIAVAGLSAGIIYLKNNDNILNNNSSATSNSVIDDNSESEMLQSDLRISLYEETINRTTNVITLNYVYNVINTKTKRLSYALESRFANYINIRLETQNQNIFVDILQPFEGDAIIPFTTDTNVSRSIIINLDNYIISQIEVEPIETHF